MRAVFEETVQNASLYKRSTTEVLQVFEAVERVIGDMLEQRRLLGLDRTTRVTVYFDNGVARVSLEVG